ncbi:DUF3800 domain-containing protein [Mesorhizobium sp. M2A.F.Ca.ET.042.01.1.1]|uniref:DUF3800 domain-containing protein n=1 Tax=Mesorhizobium sp. M2A.F.Ca.ET.042.01.1.1 TaxID=2496745 RepID=UPI001FE10ACF|nr:DUF3800 domain-containing protein [Mesorhizobium sp. M2A.F.Ca.ET.042.01.1.1]
MAYIDEAGDPGIQRVRPIDNVGGTEWITLSAVLVRKPNLSNAPHWVRNIVADIGVTQRRDLHFRDLSPTRKMRACTMLAELPVRLFVVCSNKRNMRQYRNERAEKVLSNQWFYNWLVRILIERVTHYCERDSNKRFGAPRYVKFEFSQRGGHSYSQTAAYHELLKLQSKSDTTVLKKWGPRWSVMHWKLVDYYSHKDRAGLQLSDVVASSFYHAVDNLDTGPCDPRFARLLRPRVAFRGTYNYADYGVVLQPTPDWKADISEAQRAIFRDFGYTFQKKW